MVVASSYQLESRTGTVIATVAVLLTFTTILVSLRIYTRAVMLRTMGADDWAILAALVSGNLHGNRQAVDTDSIFKDPHGRLWMCNWWQ
jgi:hypothetical protein